MLADRGRSAPHGRRLIPAIASATLIAHLLEAFAAPPAPGLEEFTSVFLEEPPMFPGVHAAFTTFTARFEGSTRFMYLDDRGLVTVGKGNLIDMSLDPSGRGRLLPFAPAFELEWEDASGRPANQIQIRAEWMRVKQLQAMKGDGGGAFGKGAQLFATAASIAKLIEADLADDERVLRNLLPGYDTFEADAQLAILDMAWAMGPGFVHGYPRWTAAAIAGQWGTAAQECAITHPVNDSITARNAANALLFRNAAQVRARKLAAEALYYPRDLEAEFGPLPAVAAGAV